MKVSELVAQLLELDQDALVVLSSDSEGNSYHPVHDIAAVLYSGYDNEVYEDEEELISATLDEDYDDDDLADIKETYNLVPAVAIWP